MKKKTYLLAALLILLGCTLIPSCTEFDAEGDWVELDNPNDGQPTDSTAVYMLPTPQYIALTAQQQDFAQDNNAFTLRFLKAVNDVDSSGKSFIYSPLSITYVLSMVNAVAEGQTSQEIEQTLGFMLGYKEAELDDVNAYCQMLIEELPQTDPNVQLSMANAIFVNNDYTLKPKFQQDMQTYYHALAESLDFSSPATLGHINGWCNEQTRGMIPTILEKVNPDAMSYLLNAVYFKAGWTSKFDPQNTNTETFTCEDGSTRQVPLMHQTVVAAYFKADEYSALRFCYGSGLWNMTIMLPGEGKTTADIINRLASLGWLEGRPHSSAYMDTPIFEGYEVDLKLPRFGTKSDTDDLKGKLPDVLRSMGIRQVFDPDLARVPNLCERANLYIGLMRQKAAIEVNEEGAKASAVTIGGMVETSVGPEDYQKVDFHANRPFVYAIQEASTGVILFVGKYTGE